MELKQKKTIPFRKIHKPEIENEKQFGTQRQKQIAQKKSWNEKS